jgi:hypothetical protein
VKIVADTSPLIAFAILDKLDSQAVFDEISVWNKHYCLQLKDFFKNKVRPVENADSVCRFFALLFR